MIGRTAVLVTLMLSVPALAQTAAPQAAAPAAAAAVTLAPGAAVTGPSGNPVGTVVSVDGPNAIVRTDKYDVALPISSMRVEATGAVVGVTREELNAGVEQAMAKVNQLFVAGSPVYGPAGNAVGNIDVVEAEFVTLKLTGGQSVRLPRSGFAAGPNGLMIGLTEDQIKAQLPS